MLSDPTSSLARPTDRPKGQNLLTRYWGSITIVLLSFAMLLWTYQTGRNLGMADTLSKLSWARSHYSTGIAISRLEYGAPGYLILMPVWEALSQRGFFSSAVGFVALDPNQGMLDALGLTIDGAPAPGSPPLYLDDWGDDKGNADYFMLSFLLFGYAIQSLYHFYFLVLAVSLTIFLVQYFRDTGYLIFAPLFLAAHHLSVVTLLDNMVTSTVHDAHFLPAVACLASLHIALLLIRSERNTLWSVPALIVQAAIIVLVVGSRPSGIWLVYFPVGTFVLSLGLMLVRRQGFWAVSTLALRRLPIVLLLLAGPKLLATYQSLVFDRAYTESGIESHMVWHSLYMGLSVHPDAHLYGLVYTDGTSYRAGYQYLASHPELAQKLNIDLESLGYDHRFMQDWITKGVGFRRYEEIGKHNFLSFVAEHPRYVVESFLLYKPKYLVEQILWQAGLRTEWPSWVKVEAAHLPPTRHALDLFAIPSAAVVLLSAIVAFASGGARRASLWIALSLLLFLSSLLPSIVVAPVYYELPVVFGLVALLMYALGAAALVPILSFLTDLARSRTMQPARARLAMASAAALAIAIVGIQGHPLYAAPTTPEAAKMPGRIPSEIVRDSFGQVWIVTMNDDRHLFPDWETYIMVGGDPTFASLREVDLEELRESRAHGLTGSLTDRLPDRLMEPSARVRSIETGATNGPVEVPAGSVNLALGRPAEMGTTGAGGAPLAVDGDTRGMRADATMAASDGEQFGPWWQVDLGEVQPVSYVQVWPSVDGCCGEQLNNFLVFTSDRKFDSVEVRKVQRQRGVADLFVLGRAGLPTTVAIDRRVRFVRVQVARSSTLDLAEVMVWSDPSAGRSGR